MDQKVNLWDFTFIDLRNIRKKLYFTLIFEKKKDELIYQQKLENKNNNSLGAQDFNFLILSLRNLIYQRK